MSDKLLSAINIIIIIGFLLWKLYELYISDRSEREVRVYQAPTNINRDINLARYPLGTTSLVPILTDTDSTVGCSSIDLHRGRTQGNSDVRISAGEQMCREVVSELYPHNIIRYNVRGLKGLTNPITGADLELDILVPDEFLAIEYQGAQHYGHSSRYNANEKPDALISEPGTNTQQYRDNIKKIWAQKNGITLICVPYTLTTKTAIFEYIDTTLAERMS